MNSLRLSADFRYRRPRRQSLTPDLLAEGCDPQQKRFVRECLETDEPIDAVMLRHRIDSRRLSKWLLQTKFCAYLECERQALVKRLKTLRAQKRRRDAAAALMRFARDQEMRRRADSPSVRPMDHIIYPVGPFLTETTQLLKALQPEIAAAVLSS
jgi:hypothetical protein